MLTFRLLFISFLFFVTSVGQQFHFKNYSLEEGLSRSGVYHILQDKAGFLWIATDGGGVCKFDGINFKNYTRQDGLASEKVRVIFEDKSSNVWFGTDNGISIYDGESFTTMTTDDGISDNYIRSITQDKTGNIWIGTSRGISIVAPDEKLVSKKLKSNFNLPHKKIRSVLADTINDIVWIGTDAGLCKWQDSKIIVYDTNDGLANNIILSLFLDKKNKLWVGTQNGLSMFKDDFFTSWNSSDGLINNRVRSINEDLYGNIWIGTKTGVSIYNGESFLNLTVENGLSNERIRSIHCDKFDNIWLGTYFGGIMKFNYKDFIAYTPKEGLISNQILTIIEDEKGDIITGSFDGVTKIKIIDDKLKSIKYVTEEQGLLSSNTQAIFKDENGNYWYGTDKGITVIKKDEIIHFTKKNGLKNDNITAIKYYNGIYYIGTQKGLAELSINADYSINNLSFITKSDGLAGNEISFIEKDSLDHIWIGFVDGQISVLTQHQMINPILPKNISEITSIAFDNKNRVWIGTNGRGLYYGNINLVSKNLHLKNISNTNTLSSNYIFSVLYLNNKIWVGNEKGLNLIEFKSDSTFNVQTLGLERGFLGLQTNKNASHIDKKGNLWFGTVNGLYCLKSRELETLDKGKTSINYIHSVIVNKNINWKDSEYADGVKGIFSLPENLKLPYNLNNISFEFIALNFVAPKKIKYSWKLEGFDKTWSPLSEKKYMPYTNLEPGNYSFQLKSTNEKGELLEKITSFDFIIEKPIWKTWWFRILGIFLTFGLVLLFMRFRTRKLIQKQKDLEDIISLRTEEVVRQKDELIKTKFEIETQNEELQIKNKEITDSILYSRRIQRSILPSKEKTKLLLDQFFIFYKPKDIVSGDFYWIEKSDNKVFFAVADCTGHGVPGAMVSLISTRALNSSLLEHQLIQPNHILDKTTQIVTESFTDYETGTIIKDGMDIALGSLDYSKNKIIFEYSGAQNSVWIIRKIEDEDLVVNGIKLESDISTENHKLFVIKGTKQPIGHFDKKIPFANNVCSLSQGDKIYFSSDGFPDQFGGVKETGKLDGKKYKYKKLKLFLLSIQHHPINRQKLDLENEFYSWKQDLEQVDDVCIMGLKV